MSAHSPRIEVIELEFRDEKTPYSPRFQDIYFSPTSGIDESQYLYLEGSGYLDSLMRGKDRIMLAEIGFGVGLNFLLTLKAFLAHAKPGQTLHYVSIEKFPVKKSGLEKLYQAYPELKEEAEALLANYPCLTPGLHRIHLANQRVTLDLVLGDANEMLPRLEFKANHWYWDGFAPRRNEDAFSLVVMKEVARLSAPGAQGSSFTAASQVRLNLEASGFKIEKRTGFGKKRESIIGTLIQESNARSPLPAWFSNEKVKTLNPRTDRVAVLGAGVAGSAIARVLANQGAQVHVFDPNGIANQASGNTMGLFNVQLSRLPNPISRFSQLSLTSFIAELKDLSLPHHLGIERREADTEMALRTSDYPEDFYEVKADHVYFPECGIVKPSEVCERRLAHPGIQFFQKGVKKTKTEGNQLRLQFLDGKLSPDIYDHVIYAIGSDLKLPLNTLENETLDQFPVRPIRGQTILVKPNASSSHLKNALVEGGYVSPLAPEVSGHEYHLIGATYQAKNIESNQEALDCEKLVSEAKDKWKDFKNLTLDQVVSSKVGYRLSTPDKLPLIGPLVNASDLEPLYRSSLRGARAEATLPSLPVIPGEWIFTALGSRGITFSSLGAEILASMMLGLPLPIELDLVEHLHSARFFVRNLRKPDVQSS